MNTEYVCGQMLNFFDSFIIVNKSWMASLLYPRQLLVWPQQMWRLPEHLQIKKMFSLSSKLHRVPTLPTLPLGIAKAGKNDYFPPPHWDRRVIQPNHIKFRTCSALAPM
jgi:hypothetical protein